MATAISESRLNLDRSGLLESGLSPSFRLPAMLLLLAIPALALDMPVAGSCSNRELPGDVGRAINLFEFFGQGTGVGLVLMIAATLDVERRRRLIRVAACAFSGGLLANLGKLLVARVRPYALTDELSVFDTFQAWLPLHGERTLATWSNGEQGFPSAHAATAFGLAAGISVLYPRGRWLFFAMASAAGVQRIFASAHFLSDVLVGAAAGCLAAAMLGQGEWLGWGFDRWERRGSQPAP